MRRAAKVDTTQRDIVDGLRAAGAQVFILGQPCDLLVRYYSNRYREWTWQTLECKTPRGKKSPKAVVDKRQLAQIEFLAATRTPVVLSLSDAKRELGMF